eukprot:m.221708 g.221708  ORF g.221708 m.221708 type:complete len:108 (-) comp19192_c0_seq1:21-344(-)
MRIASHVFPLLSHGSALVNPFHGDVCADGQKHTHQISLRKGKYRRDFDQPIDANCTCSTCQQYSRAYVHHLVKAQEFVAGTFLTVHNMHVMNTYMSCLRERIYANDI